MIRTLTAVLLAVTLVACITATPTPSPAPTPTPTPAHTVAASPTPGVTATVPATNEPTPHPSSPIATARPSPEPTPAARFEWQRIGSVDRWSQIIGFDEGYVLLTRLPDSSPASALRFSTDARAWSDPVVVHEIIVPCPGWTPRPSVELYYLYTNGTDVITVGTEQDASQDDCNATRPVAFISHDGRIWERLSDPRGPGVSSAIWPVADGWEWLGVENDDGPEPGESVVYRSDDESGWERVAGLGNELAPDDFRGPLAFGAAAPDGTRLLMLSGYVSGDENLELTLRRSSDGASWSLIEAPFTGTWSPEDVDSRDGAALLSPTADQEFWFVVVQAEFGDASTWVTSDLAEWQHSAFPRPFVSRVIQTRLGIVADGQEAPCFEGGSCPEPHQAQFLSVDGLNWTKVGGLSGELTMTDGPAGVILIGWNTGRVWNLVSVP